MMKKCMIIIGIIGFLICVCISCQKTPEVVVGNKANSNLLETALESNDDEGEADLEKEKSAITEKLEKNNVNINVNAKVNIPENTRIPVFYATDSVMNQNDIDHFISACAGKKPVYSDPMTIFTKEEYAELIVQLKQQLAQWKNYNNLSYEQKQALDNQFASPEENIAMLEEEIIECEVAMKTAPDSHSTEETPIIFNENGFMSLAVDVGRKNPASITIWEKPYTMMYCREEAPERPNLVPKEMQEKLNSMLQIDENKAVKIAEEMTRKLDIGKIVLGNVTTAMSFDQTFAYYAIKFNLDINGIPITSFDVIPTDSSDADIGIPKETEYGHPLLQPDVQIFVDGTGEIISVYLQNEIMIGDCVNDNVKVIGLDQAVDIFRNNIFFKNWTSNEDYLINIDIYEVQLSLMVKKQLNKPEEHLIIPVWDFIGTKKIDINGVSSISEGSFLTINAIDGSIVDRTVGY